MLCCWKYPIMTWFRNHPGLKSGAQRKGVSVEEALSKLNEARSLNVCEQREKYNVER